MFALTTPGPVTSKHTRRIGLLFFQEVRAQPTQRRVDLNMTVANKHEKTGGRQ